MSGLSAGPDIQPVTGPSAGRSVAASTPIAGGRPAERQPVRARAHARRGASSDDVGRRIGSFAKTGTSDIRATAPTISPVRSDMRAEDVAPSSSSGPERWTSIADDLRPRLQRADQPHELLERCRRAIDTITGAPPLARRGSSASMNAWIPGFCSPVVHTVPGRRLGDPRGRRPLAQARS